MSTHELLFSAEERDGLVYISPLPVYHRLYWIRDIVRRIGRLIDRVLFPGLEKL
jgi:hypothetical protein